MSRVSLGILCGLAFGALDTALMIPLSFPDNGRPCSVRSSRVSVSDS